MAPELFLKMNAESVAGIIDADEDYRANIIEISLSKVSQDLMTECRERGLRVMLIYGENDPHAFRQMLSWHPDMVNVNHGDVFAQVAAAT
jgi:hypothetical protein